jgi:hypothetical protein
MSDANLSRIAYQFEPVYGQLPNVTQPNGMRFTSCDLAHNKTTVMSNEIRPDRNVTSIIETGAETSGSIGFELAGTYNWTHFLSAAFCCSSQPVTTYAGRKGELFRNGTIFRSLFIELKLTPISFLRFHGMMIDEMALNFAAREIITGTWTFMGKESTVVTAPFYEPVRAVANNPVLNATSNFATVIIDGKVADVGIQAITLTTRNNLRQLPAIGYKSAFGVGSGRFEVTGTMNCYFKDTSFYKKFVNHQEMSLFWRVQDANGQMIEFSIPDVFLGPAGSPTVEGINTDVMMNFDFQAKYNPTIQASITSTLTQLNSTTTTAAFVQPAVNATVIVSVAETRANGFVVNQAIWIPVGGYYQVTAWAPGSMTLRNIGHAENAAALANIASGSSVIAILKFPV